MIRIGLIGSGVAAECFKFTLLEKGLGHKISLVQLTAEGLIPSASFNTTSIVALRGTEQGLSPLGDLIVSSYKIFCELFNQNKFAGVERANLFHSSLENSEEAEKLKRRYNDLTTSSNIYTYKTKNKHLLHKEECYIITPELFIKSLSDNSKFHEYKFIKTIVSSINNTVVEFIEGELTFDLVIDCSGASYLSYEHFNQENIIKPAHGSYLYSKMDLGNKGFALSLNELNFIYRAQTSEVLIGSTTDGRNYLGVDGKNLLSIYNKFNDEFNMNLIDFSQFEIKQAIRAKGRKMLPVAKKVDDNLYLINNLYKNGFSFSFSLCSDLIDDFILENIF